jgi:3-oxoacyl-[acyl-carrier protein] reductase
MIMRLKDKVALITGGANGIGLATAKRFAEEGAHIILWDISEKGEDVVRQLNSSGYQAIFQRLSVANEPEVNSAVNQANSHFGKIDLLVNNAGITRDRTLLKMTREEWDEVISVNLTGVFNCTKAVAPIMKSQKYGRIISTSSVVGMRGNFGQTNYVASKSAIIGMTKVWALELGKYGITANCIAPGFISTEMTDQMPEEVRNQMISQVPLGCWGQPVDIANASLFLASDEARYINGVCLNIDGGFAR